MTSTPARVLTIAGSDAGGGAGIQADLKTIAAHGAYGASAITAVTAQNTCGVTAVEVMPAALVGAQIDAVLEDIGADGIKVGMLASRPIVEVVAARMAAYPSVPWVVDPVMIATSGDALLDDDAVADLRRHLLPNATVVTPNLPEARRLADDAGGATVFDGQVDLARHLAKQLAHPDRDGPAVLLKGGHGTGRSIRDLLVTGDRVRVFEHPRIDTTSTHGTGCTLAAAVACRLASGACLATAVGGAIDYLQRALAAAYPLGRGHGPVNHRVDPGA